MPVRQNTRKRIKPREKVNSVAADRVCRQVVSGTLEQANVYDYLTTKHIWTNPGLVAFDDHGNLVLGVDYVLPLPAGGFIVVPAGFKSDGGSIPPWAWPIVGPPLRSKAVGAYVGHDWLCVLATTYPERAYADMCLFYWQHLAHVRYCRRTAIYSAVRLWGRMFWRQHSLYDFERNAWQGGAILGVVK